MSTATTSRPSRSPWNAHAQDRPKQRPSTTPHGLPTRTPTSVSQPMPPMLSPNSRSPRASQDPRTPSPNYFGFVVDQSHDPPDSNPGNHAKKNWDFPTSSARNAAAPTPRTVPLDANPEFELFRRQSDINRFNLGHGNLSQFTKLLSENDSSPLSPRSGNPSELQQREKENRADLGDGAAEEKGPTVSGFDFPRNASPANFGSSYFPPAAVSHATGVQDRLTRLSLPHNSGSMTPPAHRGPQRAETLPLSGEGCNPRMLGVQECADLLRQLPDEILLLDLRVYPQFSQSRIQAALNLCIPTTLLKRPSFNLQKLADTFTNGGEKNIFESWRQSKYIMVYDANSVQMKDAVSSTNVLKKFLNDGYKGHACIVRGGFSEFSKKYPTLIDQSQVNAQAPANKSPLAIAAPRPGVAPVAGGCPMPATKTAANPFFGNIRQNMDLIGGVGQMPIKHPSNMTQAVEATVPKWLRDAASISNKGKDVADKFLNIEKAEQSRMQEALSGHVSYGSPHPDNPKSIQIAGIEKGSKNRYNNIFPYDHARVKLQGVPKGSCDYFNASYVKTAYSNKHYIATQAPIPATFNVSCALPSLSQNTS
jgi:tyrosine-protein phosphatase 2/3